MRAQTSTRVWLASHYARVRTGIVLFKLRWVPVAVFIITMVEVMLLVRVGRVLGVWLLLFWLAATATIGVALLRSAASARPMGGPRQRGGVEMTPAKVAEQVADRAVLSGAAVLLIIPGFLSDLVAALLLVPGNRRALVGLLAARFAGSLTGAVSGMDRDAADAAGQGPASIRRAGTGDLRPDARPDSDVIEGEFTRHDDER